MYDRSFSSGGIFLYIFISGFVKNNNNKNETLLMEMKRNCFCVKMMKDFIFLFLSQVPKGVLSFLDGNPQSGFQLP